MKIAVLITTFNRKDKTVACLQQLRKQILQDDVKLTVYLTDDASKDGTAEAAAGSYPDIHIFHGNGSLFWAGGMRKSWSEARKDNPDFYLLINDDTVLVDNAVSRLLETYDLALDTYKKPAVCVGSTQDVDSKKTSYGGRILHSKKKVQSYLVEGNETITECDLGNANIMLVPREVCNEIGILSEAYTHGIADYDYTLSAGKKGFLTVVAPGILGFCKDDHGNNWKSTNTKLRDRIAYLYSPKGLAYKEYLYFIKKHFPSHYAEAFSKLWLKTFFPFLWDSMKK